MNIHRFSKKEKYPSSDFNSEHHPVNKKRIVGFSMLMASALSLTFLADNHQRQQIRSDVKDQIEDVVIGFDHISNGINHNRPNPFIDFNPVEVHLKKGTCNLHYIIVDKTALTFYRANVQEYGDCPIDK